jgi:Protein of unknown function (DUF5131)
MVKWYRHAKAAAPPGLAVCDKWKARSLRTGQATGIEWRDHTYNPWMGCTKVSPACDHCYAEAQDDARYGRVEWAGHVGAPAKQLAALHTAGIARRRRPENGAVFSACRWVIFGTIKCRMGGALRP